jgi:hypothetical protein
MSAADIEDTFCGRPFSHAIAAIAAIVAIVAGDWTSVRIFVTGRRLQAGGAYRGCRFSAVASLFVYAAESIKRYMLVLIRVWVRKHEYFLLFSSLWVTHYGDLQIDC